MGNQFLRGHVPWASKPHGISDGYDVFELRGCGTTLMIGEH